MKKIFSLFFILFICLISCFFTSCKKVGNLMPYVSDLRTEVFSSEESSPVKITAHYIRRENPYKKDGEVSPTSYSLVFKMSDAPVDDVSRTAAITYRGKNYSDAFIWNYAEGCYTASVSITDFTEKSFTLSFFTGAEKSDITMASIIPVGTYSAEKILSELYKAQPTLIKSYYGENGNFSAEITARVLCKNGKAYWYIAITDKALKTHAFLMDGSSGELLAIREIF